MALTRPAGSWQDRSSQLIASWGKGLDSGGAPNTGGGGGPWADPPKPQEQAQERAKLRGLLLPSEHALRARLGRAMLDLPRQHACGPRPTAAAVAARAPCRGCARGLTRAATQ